jgi:uncharacterized SAM-binding protein YcdF (DUF218 family)
MEVLLGILAMARWPFGPVDAIVVPTGQGEESRVTHAIQLWEAARNTRHLLVANGNPAERTYVPITRDYLAELGLHRQVGVRVQEEPAPSTGLQATWIADQVRRLGITSLLLAVTPYHLPRAYLTVLKALNVTGVRIPVLPYPIPVSPDATAPETGAGHYELLPGEAHRIIEYTARGWVVTVEEFRAYQRWLWISSERAC